MGREITYKIEPGSTLTKEEIAMIEAARNLPAEYDEDNPEIDPVTTPEQYAALMQAVAERNRRIARKARRLG